MMGRQKSNQGQLFYEFHLDEAVPEDHLVRRVDAALDLSWLRSGLAPHYSSMGRPSIDPELMIRMLVVGYVFAIRSERLICREVQVNLAYRWFCKLGIEDAIPDHSAFSRARNERFRDGDVSAAADTAIDASVRSSYAAFSSLMTDWTARVKRWRCGLSAAERLRLGVGANWRCDDV